LASRLDSLVFIIALLTIALLELRAVWFWFRELGLIVVVVVVEDIAACSIVVVELVSEFAGMVDVVGIVDEEFIEFAIEFDTIVVDVLDEELVDVVVVIELDIV
jgi:hypothetical protein